MNAWTADAGMEAIGPHDELDDFAGRHEELYLVVSGRATFRVGSQEIDAPRGTLLFVGERGITRGAVAHEARTTILSLGGWAGSFEVAPWEWLVRAGAEARMGRLDAAIAILADGLTRRLGRNSRP